MNPARMVYPGFWFGKTDLQDAYKLAEMGVGGFCLYWGTPAEIEKFSSEIRKRSPYSSILITADYEDGLGRWVKGTELLPSNMALGAAGEEDLAAKKGLITARQAKSLGIDWIFAPVVDLASTAGNPIVNTRAFSYKPEVVTKLSIAFMAGLSQGGVLNSLKHFPGHGATASDSHLTLPFIQKPFDELFDIDLHPYRHLFKFADSIMVGHLLIPSLDEENPSSLSEKTIRGLLRKKLNYKGCVLTDAMNMQAITEHKDAEIKALRAGSDILLVPADPFKTIETLNSLSPEDSIIKDSLVNSIATQEMLLAKNTKAEVRTPEHTLFKSSYSIEAAPKCLTSIGRAEPYQKGEEVFYLDFDCKDFLQTPFAAQLLKNGIVLTPYVQGAAKKLLLASYNGYASFKGYVNLTKEQKSRALAAAHAAEEVKFVSFGSPFVHKDFLKIAQYHLLAYCPNEDFQLIAADNLCGLVKVTGTLPIKFI